jgi:hypothetical protein
MSDISFLPSDKKEQEEEIRRESLKTASTAVVSMHVPETEEEDVEIIEVDASEVDQMLIGEPLYTRLYYKASLFVDSLKQKYLAPRPIEAPAKTPPQFFKPPAKGAEAPAKTPTKPGETPAVLPKTQVGKQEPQPTTPPKPGEAPAKPKAFIRPAAKKPTTGRRVRIIKRVRKPVHVSLLDEQVMRELHINIPKRQFTLVFLTILFGVIFTGAFLLLDQAIAQALTQQEVIQSQYISVRNDVKIEQDKWQAFQDLEPRLIALNDLLDTHISANKVLQFLEENTLVDISYHNFMMSDDGRVNLGVTATDYNAAARQLLIFEESPYVQAAESNSFATANLEGKTYVSFQLVLYLKPEIIHFSDQKNDTPVK